MAEVAGKSTVLKISGTSTSMTAEATSTSDDQVYQITSATKQVLDRDNAPTVLDGGVETVETYTVNYLTGTITFGSVDGTRVITVTGYYLPMTTAAYAHNSSHNRTSEILDVTAYADTHKKRLAGLLSASGVLSQFDITDTTFSDALIAGVPVVLEINSDSSVEPTRYWVLLDSDEVVAAVDGVQDENVSWVSYDAWIRLGS